MRNRGLRWIVVLLAILAVAGAAYQVWSVELAVAAERQAGDTFERQARHLVVQLGDLRAALQAYVADGQVTEVWQTTAARLQQGGSDQAAALQGLARSADGRRSMDTVLEGLAGSARMEARAREFLSSSQRLSASDVVFAEASPHIARTVAALDAARGHESVASAIDVERLRVRQLSWLGAAVAVMLIALLVLVPVPRPATQAAEDTGGDASPGTGLGIGHVAPSGAPAAARHTTRIEAPSLAGTAELCSALARVQEPQELPSMLEKAASVLHTSGVMVWMPDGPAGSLRPTLAHGYAPVAISRMGTIPTDADNATAAAYRTRTPQVIPPDGSEPGAIAAPLVTAEGCSGVMTAEVRPGVDADAAGAAAAIIAAQLATLISPQPPSPARAE